MSANSKIEWTDHTFNAWEGCQKVGPGCDNCYAETRNARFGGGVAVNWGPDAPRRRTSVKNWNLPKRWNAGAAKFMAEHGRRQRVFCSSLADVFDNAADPQWRLDLFRLIEGTPDLDWLLLTKRIGNVRHQVWPRWMQGGFPPNVWIGATIVNQAEADRDIPKLLALPARVRFLSMEPLLGPVELRGYLGQQCDAGSTLLSSDAGCGVTCDQCDGQRSRGGCPGVQWVIAGGESGPGARPMHPDWARSLRDQCEAAGAPFLFKQWGEWKPMGQMPYSEKLATDKRHMLDDEYLRPDGTTHTTLRDDHEPFDAGDIVIRRVGKKAAGRLLDGRSWDGAPS